MKKLCIVAILALFVAGCATFSDNKAAVLTFETATLLSKKITRAEKSGFISAEEESELLDKLSDAVEDAMIAEQLLDVCDQDCEDAEGRLARVDMLLTEIEQYLISQRGE